MTTAVLSKVKVSVISKDMPLEKCEIGTELYIKKDVENQFDPKALSVFVRHKRTGRWTFIGYVAANPDFVPDDGINNAKLFDLLGQEQKGTYATVVDKMQVVFPYDVKIALVVDVELDK